MSIPQTDRIEIRGLRVFGHHGVYESEKRDGQTFVLDVALEADLSAAAASDALGDTVDYGTLAQRLADEVRSTRFALIERLAGHLLDLIMADPLVASAEVRIAKPDAPVDVDLDEVAVVLRRRADVPPALRVGGHLRALMRGAIDPRGVIGDLLARHQPPSGQETAFLGLGGNLGDRVELLNAAVRLLHDHPRIVVDDISSVYETDPLGPSDEEYLNIAVRVLTDLSPMRLLRACHDVEDALGRVRTVRWGARTMDVDILLYGDRVMDSAVLTVPHAELRARAFALVPLLEVAPGWQLPDGTSLATAIVALAPIEGITAIGRQVSLVQMPSGPPTIAGGPA